ncbi:glycosyltransferase [Candidatus Dojkabacteria bacterium]|nr:glycosyltransferase [Candidatus Dojkabacteria bacterium]
MKELTKFQKIKDLRVALVHDFLTEDGGAERVLRVFHEIWPKAPVYTVTYFPESFEPRLDNWDIRTSFVAKLPFRKKLEHQYKLFYQFAVEQFKFDDYDLVISSTFSGYAKGVVVPTDCRHFSYIHNIPRFLWGLPTATHGRLGFLYKKVILPPLEHFWRIWDRQTADRPDKLICNSKVTQSRVKKFYKRDSAVIYPPVEVEKLLEISEPKQDYYVYFGRLEEYKRVDMAIKACSKAGKKLKIIGDGSYRKYLEKVADESGISSNIEFLGRVSDNERNKVVAAARAFIFPCPDEDFGIVPIESMALGTPVIAFNSGGVTESVVNNETGILIDEFSVDALSEVLKSFDLEKFDLEKVRERATNFSRDRFVKRILSYISENI